MLKLIVFALRIGIGRVFYNAEPGIEQAFEPALVCIRGTTNLY